MKLIHRLGEKGEKRIEISSNIRVIHHFLRQQLEGMLPIGIAEKEINGKNIYFRGQDNRMEFAATMPGHLRQSGIYKQVFEIVDNYNEQQLILRFGPVNPPENVVLSLPEPLILLSAKDIIFKYHAGFNKEDDEEELIEDNIELWNWLDTWEEKKSFPAYILIDITFNDNSKKKWPSFLVAPIRQGNKK